MLKLIDFANSEFSRSEAWTFRVTRWMEEELRRARDWSMRSADSSSRLTEYVGACFDSSREGKGVTKSMVPMMVSPSRYAGRRSVRTATGWPDRAMLNLLEL